MSGDISQNASVQPLKKKGRMQQIKEFIRPPDPTQRIQDDFGVLKEVAGLRYLQNIKDLEQRRKEIGLILAEVEQKSTTSRRMERGVIERTWKMFFLCGSPWYRGLDNRILTKKVASFNRLYNECGCLEAYRRDLFMCSMQLLHLSFQAIDVTNTPAYVIQTPPMITLNRGGTPQYQTPEGKATTGAGAQQE